MKEIGIDQSKHYSKSVDDLDSEFLTQLDYVITLCAEEVCPTFISQAKRLHWPLPDPAGHEEMSYQDQLQRFRVTREAIRTKLIAFKEENQI